MSSTTTIIICIQLITLIPFIHADVRQCDLSSSIHLQAAAYIHSLILRVQPIYSPEEHSKMNRIHIRKVRVREVIKISRIHQQPIKTNDLIIIRINDDLDDSCWHLLGIPTVDVIIFLNQTNTDEFDLHDPPVESTLRVRQHIDAVLHHETYSPQVLIKPRLDKPFVYKDYSLQCNSRGNPIPRLFWSKRNSEDNQTLEYYPLAKQCKSTCRIYSIQTRYQSVLYFQSLTLDDSGIYVCHAENPMNRTTTSVYLDIDPYLLDTTVTCASLKYCHQHGQCLTIRDQLKCFCESGYFGEQCETHYTDVVKKQQDAAMLLFKSRFLAGSILALVGILLIFLALLSYFLARNHRKQRQRFQSKLPIKPSIEKPLISPVKDIISSTETKDIIPPSSPIAHLIKSPSLPASVHISHSPIREKKPLPRTITRQSSTATEEDDDEGIHSFLRHHQTFPPVPTKIDEEYEERFSLNMNKSEELGLGCLTNGINTNDRYQTGVIKPLDLQKDPPQRYTKYVSSYSKFVLPRPVKSSSSSSEYQQR